MFDGLIELILNLMYGLWLCGAYIVNLIEDLFRMLVGLNPVQSGVDSGADITTLIINNKGVRQIFTNLVAFATIMLIFFTILQIIREHYKDKHGGNPYVLVFRMVKAMVLFMFVTAACIIGLQLSSVVLRALDRATGYDPDGGIGGVIFVAMAASGNRVSQGIEAQSLKELDLIDDQNLYAASIAGNRKKEWQWQENPETIQVFYGGDPDNIWEGDVKDPNDTCKWWHLFGCSCTATDPMWHVEDSTAGVIADKKLMLNLSQADHGGDRSDGTCATCANDGDNNTDPELCQASGDGYYIMQFDVSELFDGPHPAWNFAGVRNLYGINTWHVKNEVIRRNLNIYIIDQKGNSKMVTRWGNNKDTTKEHSGFIRLSASSKYDTNYVGELTSTFTRSHIYYNDVTQLKDLDDFSEAKLKYVGKDDKKPGDAVGGTEVSTMEGSNHYYAITVEHDSGRPVNKHLRRFGLLNASYFYLTTSNRNTLLEPSTGAAAENYSTLFTYYYNVVLGESTGGPVSYSKLDTMGREDYANWIDNMFKRRRNVNEHLRLHNDKAWFFKDRGYGQMRYPNVRAVNMMYDIKSFNFIVGFGGLFIAMGVYNSFAFGMIQRIAELGVLYMFSPVTLAFFPFDDGAQFNNAFVKPFYKKAISSYAPVLSLNLFFVVLPAFDAIRWFQNGLLNTVASCIVSIALLSMLPKVRTTIQTMLGADPMEEKKMFGKGGVLANAAGQTAKAFTAPKALQKFGVARAMNARDIAARVKAKRDARKDKRDGITSGAYMRDRKALTDAAGKVMQDENGNAIYESQEAFNKRTGLGSRSPLGAARREAARRSLKNDDLNAQLKAAGVSEADMQGLTGVALRHQRDRANKKEERRIKSGKLTGEEGLNSALEGAGAVPGGAFDGQAAADAINKGSMSMRRQTYESLYKNAGKIANVTEEVKDKDGNVVKDEFGRVKRRVVRDKDGNAVKREMTAAEIKRATDASLKSGRKLTAQEVETARKDGGLETTRERMQRERDNKILEENGKSIADRMLTDPARAKAVNAEAKTASEAAEAKAVQDAMGNVAQKMAATGSETEKKEIAQKWLIEMGFTEGQAKKAAKGTVNADGTTNTAMLKHLAENSNGILGGRKARQEQALQDARLKAVKDSLKTPEDRKKVLGDWVAAEKKAGRNPNVETEVSDKDVRSALVASRQRAWDEKAYKHLKETDSVALKTKEQGGMLDANNAKHRDFFEIEKDKDGNPIAGGKIMRDQNGHPKLKTGDDFDKAFYDSLGDIDSDNRKTFKVNKAVFDTGIGGAWNKTKHMAKGALSTAAGGPWAWVDAAQGKIGDYLESDAGKNTYMGTLMTTLFQPDFGLFYDTNLGKSWDALSYHKTFQGLDQLEKARSERLKSEAFARGRTYRFAGQFADVARERDEIIENGEMVKQVYNSTNPDVALQNKEDRENFDRMTKQNIENKKDMVDAIANMNGEEKEKGTVRKAFDEHMGPDLLKQPNSEAYKIHAEKFYDAILNGSEDALKKISETYGSRLLSVRDAVKENPGVKATLEKKQEDVTKYEKIKSLVMEGDEFVTKDKYASKIKKREKQLDEYIGSASRVLGIDQKSIDALNELSSALKDPNGEYVKVMKGYQKGGAAAETVMLNGKLTTIDTKEAFKAYQEQAYKPYTDAVESAISGAGGYHGVAFRDYGEKTSDRMDGILGATMAAEQIKLMQDTIWKTHRDSHQLFRDPAFIKMLEGSEWQEIAEQFDKASRGEACKFDHTLVAGAKKHDLASIGNMFKDMLGDAEGEMRGGSFATASNIIARTFRTAFVDQINESLKATASMYDQNQIRFIEQRDAGMKELTSYMQSNNAEIRSVFAGMEGTIKTLDTSTDGKKMEQAQDRMLERLDALIALNRQDPSKGINAYEGQAIRDKITSTITATTRNLHMRRETDQMTYRMRELSDLDFVARNMIDRKDDKLQ